MKRCWNLQLNKAYIALILLVFHFFPVLSQKDSGFFFPIKPGQPNYLSGTMGEIRNSHFHAGIDIRTGGTSGLPVYATEDGYVSRIKVSAVGYGNSLYIKHPNGETSVYAHLFRFRSDIANWIRKEQYKKESFEVNLFPDKNLFQIEKEDLIALSGNTGSSQGPHLHFEIRDEKQRPIDPFTKDFDEIKDNVSPTAQKIVLSTLSIDSHVGNQFGHKEYDLKSGEKGYFIKEPIEVYGTLGLQIKTFDKMNGSKSRNGIPYIAMYLDDEKLFEIQIHSFSFNETRHVIVHYDYGQKVASQQTFQKLYLDDGNPLKFYTYDKRKGRLSIKDTLTHEVKIILKDYFSNESTIIIPLKGVIPSGNVESVNMVIEEDPEYIIQENILKIGTLIENKTSHHAFIYSHRMKYEVMPSYTSEKKAVYLWDLRSGLPDSVSICDKKKVFHFEVMIPSESSFNFYNRLFDLKTSQKSLYDTVYLEAYCEDRLEKEHFYIGSIRIPVQSNLTINLKPKLSYPDSARSAVYFVSSNNGFSYLGGEWNDGQIRFKTRSFGEFTILTDTIAPFIKPLRIKSDKVSFRIKDELSGIKTYEARLDGDWLLMNYDAKRNYIWSDPLDRNKSLSGELILTVEDNSGNINTYQTAIK